MTVIDDVRLAAGSLAELRPADAIRAKYARGDSFLPTPPPGLETAYLKLQQISGSALVRTAVSTVSSRIRVASVHASASGPADETISGILEASRWGSSQAMLVKDGLTFGRGVVSVWPDDPSPRVIVESPRAVWIEQDLADPRKSLWAVKFVSGHRRVLDMTTPDRAFHYTADTVTEMVAPGGTQAWEVVNTTRNPLGVVPFAMWVPEANSDGMVEVYVDSLIPIAQTIDTIRFYLLLAAQFAAYRQRIATGVDPVIRDEDGEPIFKIRRNADGTPELDDEGAEVLELDSNGMPIPMLQRPGAPGVDRLMVFPGTDTKVYDLAESDLQNYIRAAEYFAATFAATSRVPSQYLAIGDWSNVSGDTMEANESGLRTFISALQLDMTDTVRDTVGMLDISLGNAPRSVVVVFANTEPRSLTQVASAAAQMVPNGAPIRMFLEMLATSPYEVDRWMGDSASALNRAIGGDLASVLTGVKTDGTIE